MAIYTICVATSIAACVVLFKNRVTEQSLVPYILTFSVIYTAHLLCIAVYKIFIYPFYISPLRQLPTPKVSLKIACIDLLSPIAEDTKLTVIQSNQGEGSSIIFGQLKNITRGEPGATHKRWAEEIPNDGLIRYLLAYNSERLLITSPKLLAEVFVEQSYNFVKVPSFEKKYGKLLGTGLVIAEGNEHKIQRRILTPAFHFRHIKNLYPLFRQKSMELALMLEKAVELNNVQEIGQWASRATLDQIGLAGMGHDFRAIQDPANELTKACKLAFAPTQQARFFDLLSSFLPIGIITRLPIQRNADIAAASETLKRWSRVLIRNRMEFLKSSNSEMAELDILSAALGSNSFNEDELVNQVMTFLAAGHETTATALLWTIYELCRHPDIQVRLRNEIRSFLPSLGQHHAPITAETLDSVPYLHAVCNEVLRIWPPTRFTQRQAAQDTYIAGQFVPKGTQLVISLWSMNMSEDLWEDPKEFKPERWMLESGGANPSGGAKSHYAFSTFLHGPRSCIGSSFARGVLASLVAILIGRFSFELAEEEEPDFKRGGAITIRPSRGLLVSCKRIEGF